MSRIRFLLWISVMSLGSSKLLAAGTTYVAGPCKPSLPSFSTISNALAAMPPPTVVLVCPGTYNEQVQITQPVTLQGISTGDSGQAIISASGGLTQTASDDFGDSVAYQVWVNNVSGPVNISDITVDGAGNGVSNCTSFPFTFVVGIFYQNSPGTVNRVTTRNQIANSCGIGVELEGGSSNPSVTVENSSIHGFDAVGIETETNVNVSEPNATIKANQVNGGGVNNTGIIVFPGTTNLVSGNFVVDTSSGVFSLPGATGTISGNTLTNNALSIVAGADGVSVTSNRLFNSSNAAIFLNTPGSTIQGNTITAAGVGIQFNCNADNNVRSNTITDALVGVDEVPSGVVTNNTYFNVATLRSGGC